MAKKEQSQLQKNAQFYADSIINVPKNDIEWVHKKQIIEAYLTGAAQGKAIALKEDIAEQEKLQERILSLPDEGINTLMHVLGKWDENKQILPFSPQNIAALVMYGNDRGWDVDLNVEIGHDYHLLAEHVVEYGVNTYRIYGVHDEFDEWASILDIHALVGEISESYDAKLLLDALEMLYNLCKV